MCTSSSARKFDEMPNGLSLFATPRRSRRSCTSVPTPPEPPPRYRPRPRNRISASLCIHTYTHSLVLSLVAPAGTAMHTRAPRRRDRHPRRRHLRVLPPRLGTLRSGTHATLGHHSHACHDHRVERRAHDHPPDSRLNAQQREAPPPQLLAHVVGVAAVPPHASVEDLHLQRTVATSDFAHRPATV